MSSRSAVSLSLGEGVDVGAAVAPGLPLAVPVAEADVVTGGVVPGPDGDADVVVGDEVVAVGVTEPVGDAVGVAVLGDAVAIGWLGEAVAVGGLVPLGDTVAIGWLGEALTVGLGTMRITFCLPVPLPKS